MRSTKSKPLAKKQKRKETELQVELRAVRVPLTPERRAAYELSMRILHKYIQIALDEIRTERMLTELFKVKPVPEPVNSDPG
jgi:hypothetical protein